MLSNTVKGLRSALSANHLCEVGLSGYSKFSKSNSPLLFKEPPDLLAVILDEEEFEPPEELFETGAMEDEEEPPLEA